jgi:hypothetical protein
MKFPRCLRDSNLMCYAISQTASSPSIQDRLRVQWLDDPRTNLEMWISSWNRLSTVTQEMGIRHHWDENPLHTSRWVIWEVHCVWTPGITLMWALVSSLCQWFCDQATGSPWIRREGACHGTIDSRQQSLFFLCISLLEVHGFLAYTKTGMMTLYVQLWSPDAGFWYLRISS